MNAINANNEIKQITRVSRGGGRRETGEQVSGMEIVKNAVYSGLNQFNKGLAATADFLLPTEFLGKYDVVSNINDYYSKQADKYDTALEESTSNAGKVVQTGAKLLADMTAAVPNAALAFMSGGTSAAAQGGTAALKAASSAAGSSGLLSTAAGAVKSMFKNPLYWSSAARTLGTNYETAREKGAGELAAIGSAFTSSFMNSAVETGGGMETLPGILKTGSVGPATAWARSALTEGLEESIQSAVSGLSDKLFYDRTKPLASMTDEQAVLNPGRMGREFATGTAVGGILGAGQLMGSRIATPDELARKGDYSGYVQELNELIRQKKLDQFMVEYEKHVGKASPTVPTDGNLDALIEKDYDKQKEVGLYGGGEEAVDAGSIRGKDVWNQSRSSGMDTGISKSSKTENGRAWKEEESGGAQTAADWARGHIIKPVIDSASALAESQAKDYYPDVYIVEDAALKARRPNAWATTSKGVIYISDLLPSDLADVVGHHEVIHAAKQRGNVEYQRFLDHLDEQIDFQNASLLDIILEARFKKTDLLSLNEVQLDLLYDELNAVVWGFYKADADNARTQFSRMFKDYDKYITELDAIMEDFKIANWGDWED